VNLVQTYLLITVSNIQFLQDETVTTMAKDYCYWWKEGIHQ